MLKILHAHLLRTFVANSKIDAIYALYPESLSDKYLAVRKVFAFSDSAGLSPQLSGRRKPQENGIHSFYALGKVLLFRFQLYSIGKL